MMMAMREDGGDDDADGATGEEVVDDGDGAMGDGTTRYDDNNDNGGGTAVDEVDDYGKGMTGNDNNDNNEDGNGTERCNNQIKATAVAAVGGSQNGRCYLPPRMPKIRRFPPPKSKAATPSPGRFRPCQRGRQLIVMSLGVGIKWNSQNCPQGAKMAPVAQPPELTEIGTMRQY